MRPKTLIWSLVCAGLLSPLILSAQVNVLTQHNDNARTGANLNETTLTPSNVNSSQFGLLFKRTVDDQIYTQPLYVSNLNIAGGTHNVVYVGTVNNTVYALDADDPSHGTPYWQVNLGPAPNLTNNSSAWTCGNISANAGIVGTPAIDLATQTLYVVAERIDASVMRHYLHALDIVTGAEKFGGPVQIQAAGFNSAIQLQRPGLLLLNGTVYVAFGSHCDQGAYHGYLFGYDARTLVQNAFFNVSPSGEEAAIWQAGQGPTADADGNLYVITGNGTWDGVQNFGESFLKFTTVGGLHLSDWFTPSNWASLNTTDTDLGCSGVLLIADQRLIVGGTKEGKLYLLNADNLGRITANDTGAIQGFQAINPPSGPSTQSRIYGSAIYWNSAVNGPTVYVWGDGDYGRAFKLANSRLQTTPISTTSPVTAPINAVGTPGGILSLSASGGRNGILWANAVYTTATAPGVLYAFDADDLSHLLWSSRTNAADDLGNLAKFVPPTVVNGKVYAASFGAQRSGTGQLCVYGLLNGDFTLSVSGGGAAIVPGGIANYQVSLNSGYTGNVSLAVDGLPAGASATFDHTTLTGGGSATLTITTASSTAVGAYVPAVTGTAGGTSHTLLAHLNVGSVTSKLVNISTRTALTASSAMVAGTAVRGTAPKKLLIRGVGPELATYGVAGVLADPQLRVFDASGTAIATNAGWSLNANAAQIAAASVSAGAFPLPAGSADAALLLTLDPGNYTFQIGSAHANTGAAMVEAYDADGSTGSGAEMINISTQGPVGTGDRIMTAGFAIRGAGMRTILLRGIGPSLTRFGISGVLADPQIKLFDQNGVALGSNDDWGQSTTVAGRTVTADVVRLASAAVGGFSLDEGGKDAALLISLPAGNYTLQLSGSGGTTGNGMIEAYEVPLF